MKAIDGIEERIIFVFWTGQNEMTEARVNCLNSLINTECNIQLVNRDNLEIWAGGKIHPAYDLLSSIHKSDYLRAYFMHHFGGGYTDIKYTIRSWRPHFDELLHNDYYMATGYKELRNGVANIKHSVIAGRSYFLGKETKSIYNRSRYAAMKIFHNRIIGNGAFIFKRESTLTYRWLQTVERHLDIVYPLLKKNPATYHKEQFGIDYGSGPSRYPVPWSFLLGDIVAPLSLAYHRRILRNLPPPSFKEYE